MVHRYTADPGYVVHRCTDAPEHVVLPVPGPVLGSHLICESVYSALKRMPKGWSPTLLGPPEPGGVHCTPDLGHRGLFGACLRAFLNDMHRKWPNPPLSRARARNDSN